MAHFYKTMHFQQNLQSYAKKGLSNEQNKTNTQCILKIMTLSEAQSKRLKILTRVLLRHFNRLYIIAQKWKVDHDPCIGDLVIQYYKSNKNSKGSSRTPDVPIKLKSQGATDVPTETRGS